MNIKIKIVFVITAENNLSLFIFLLYIMYLENKEEAKNYILYKPDKEVLTCLDFY